MSQLTHLRLETQLKREIQEIIDQGFYATQSEFIKESIRNQIKEFHKQQAIKNIAMLKGNTKGKLFTKKERIQNAKDFAKMMGFDIQE